MWDMCVKKQMHSTLPPISGPGFFGVAMRCGILFHMTTGESTDTQMSCRCRCRNITVNRVCVL